MANMEEDIKKQIEYYVSDENLRRDIHMRNAIVESGGLTTDYLMGCPRIVGFTKGDRSLLEDALKKIKSDVFELDGTGYLIRPRVRIQDNHKTEKPPKIMHDDTLPNKCKVLENVNGGDKTSKTYKKEEIYNKTVYMRGFPSDTSETEIADWCTQFGKVSKVYLNFSKADEFDGTVYVTFDEQCTADHAVAFLAMQKGKYNGALIRVKYPVSDMKKNIMARLFGEHQNRDKKEEMTTGLLSAA